MRGEIFGRRVERNTADRDAKDHVGRTGKKRAH